MLTVNQVFGLLKKDFLFEVRHLFQFGAILGFMLGIAYLFYFYSGEQTERAWSLSYWFSFFFLFSSSVNIMSAKNPPQNTFFVKECYHVDIIIG